ncbi:hypothetical protein [Actomonas aquatica]|uniref:Uncharacterized protein n=1 Tax=Actomonas aquatica TaxID=2866162 RepID=A0ABZ1CCN6_9BACT|nr:hypothetical protein [Opitutus sp. WL0086]WRQ89331.1 hypothetical protein K1X11_007915 [Opitutus sp. WL0086]
MTNLHYTLVGTGWAEAVLDHDGESVAVSASYLSDALGDLARAAIAVVRGTGEVSFSFAEEPGEYRWILRKQSPGHHRLTLLEFDKLWGNRPDSAGTLLGEFTFESVEFGGMVLRTLAEVERMYGVSGYKERWVQYDFPHTEFATLRALLSADGISAPRR